MLPPALIPIIIIAVLAGTALLIFTVPFDLSFLIENCGGSGVLMVLVGWSIVCLKIAYTGGKGTIEIMFSGKSVYRKVISAPTAVAEIPEGAVSIRAVVSLLQAISVLWPGILRIFMAMKRQIRFQRLSCDLRLGTGSPATTGLIFGAFSAVRPLFMIDDRVSLSVTPIFDREVLEGKCRFDLILHHPLIIIALILRLFLSPGLWVRMKRIRQGKAGTAV
jgi:hypothetical protein